MEYAAINPKNLNVRMDRETGDFWITEERYTPGQPRKVKRITNVTSAVLLALCADLYDVEHTAEVTRDVKFSSGATARITITEIVPDTLPEAEPEGNTDGPS